MPTATPTPSVSFSPATVAQGASFQLGGLGIAAPYWPNSDTVVFVDGSGQAASQTGGWTSGYSVTVPQNLPLGTYSVQVWDASQTTLLAGSNQSLTVIPPPTATPTVTPVPTAVPAAIVVSPTTIYEGDSVSFAPAVTYWSPIGLDWIWLIDANGASVHASGLPDGGWTWTGGTVSLSVAASPGTYWFQLWQPGDPWAMTPAVLVAMSGPITVLAGSPQGPTPTPTVTPQSINLTVTLRTSQTGRRSR